MFFQQSLQRVLQSRVLSRVQTMVKQGKTRHCLTLNKSCNLIWSRNLFKYLIVNIVVMAAIWIFQDKFNRTHGLNRSK